MTSNGDETGALLAGGSLWFANNPRRVRGRVCPEFQGPVAGNAGFGVFMSEVVVQISADESRDAAHLSNAIDAFAKWSQETGLATVSGDAPDIMMLTEYSGGEMRRKLVFQDREHAARFLVFWRTEKSRVRVPGIQAAAG